MADFPTDLYRRGTELHNPIVGNFDDTMAHDPAIRSTSEGGYVKSRARFTRIRRKWTVHYDWMTTVNKDKIRDFEDSVFGGSDHFTWINPADGSSQDVRFLPNPQAVTYRAHPKVNFKFWMVEFILEEV